MTELMIKSTLTLKLKMLEFTDNLNPTKYNNMRLSMFLYIQATVKNPIKDSIYLSIYPSIYLSTGVAVEQVWLLHHMIK